MHTSPKHTRRHVLAKRQDDGLGGAITLANAQPSVSDLILSTGAPASAPLASIPPIAPDFTLTTSAADSSSTPTTPVPSSSPSSSQAMGSSSISTSTVVAACIGAFVGLAVLICVFIWWTRHSSTKIKARNVPRSPVSENRNAHGEMEQHQRVRSGAWNKLDEEHGNREMSEHEADEKNFSMFKKRTMSMRTTRTAKALEEHGFDMPPITKYHPELAKELALEQPERPFAQRQESGVSWDGDTVADDSFLSLRSVRIETGTMSPTFGVAKMTPPAVVSQLHKWESAEVLTLDEESPPRAEVENPFVDVSEERRKSTSNPFFSAGEVHRTASRRSRSGSRGHSHSRNASRSKSSNTRAQVLSQGSQIDPFADLPGSPETPRELPPFNPRFTHSHSESSASGGSSAFTSERAMKSLIAALELTPEEVEERLRVVSMQPSVDSRYSTLLRDLDEEIAVVKQFPDTPKGTPEAPRR